MKKLNKLFAILIAVLGVQTLSAQTDVTSTYLTNANFSSTNGWVQHVSGSYKDIGSGNIGGKLGNYAASSTDATHLNSEYFFGFQCRWNGNYASYNQVTSQALPSGVYTLSYDVENVNGSTSAVNYNNLFYVKVGDKTFTDTSVEWMKGKSSWTSHSITFVITEATKATVSLGYGTGSNNLASGNTPVLYVSHLKLTHRNIDDISAEVPADLTSYIVNNSFENGNLDGWTYIGSSDTGVKPNSNGTYTTSGVDGNYLFNTWWQGTPLTQTVGNIPNGIYELKVLLASDQNAKLFLLANDEHSEVYTITTDNKTFHDVSYEFKVLNGQAKIGVVGGNDAGEYVAAGHWWYKADNFRLIYKGADISIEKEALEANIATARAIDQATIPTAIATQLTAAITAAENVEQTLNAIKAATNELIEIINLANELKEPYGDAKTVIAECEAMSTNSTASDTDKATYQSAINKAKADLEEANAKAAIDAIMATLRDAQKAYCLVAAPTEGHPFDLTWLVVNPKFDEGTKGWTSNTSSWSNTIATNQGGAITGNYYENWNESSYTGEIYQQLENLPKGKYVLTAAAFRDQLTGGAVEGDAVYVFANDQATLVTSATPEFYSVEVSTTTGTLKFGVKSVAKVYKWMGIDNVTLQYVEALDLSEFIAAYNAALEAAEAARDNAEYFNITGQERTALEEAINNVPEENQDALSAATVALQSATAAFTAVKADYDLLATEKQTAKGLGMSDDLITTTIGNNTASVALLDLREAEYDYVTKEFSYPVELEANGWIPEGPVGSLTGQHYDGSNSSSYLEQSSSAWGSSAWEISYKYEKTLPAGKYIFKVAGRRAAGTGTTMGLTVTNVNNSNVLGSVNDFPEGDTGLGINKKGKTSFDANDPEGFANNGAGRGWQWRYVMFELSSETTVQVAVNAAATTSYQWMSFCGASLQMTEETYLDANKGGLDAPTAAAQALVNAVPMGAEEIEALEAALSMTYTTGAELLAKIEALETAVANAKAWVGEYNNAKAPLVAALERFETDYNNAENGASSKMSNSAWANILDKVQAAALAKDVTDSYDGFAVAAEELNAALDAAQASINAYTALDEAIKNAEALASANVGDQPFQRPVSAQAALNEAIATAQTAYDKAETDATEVKNTLATAVEAFNNAELNAPAEGLRFYIKVATEGHGKNGNAWLMTLGATGANNPTGYGLNTDNAAKGYLAQAFIFTQVEGNLYNISIERAEGTVYLTYGSLNGSAAGWKNQQIQATTNAENKGQFKIVPTGKNGILKIFNTIDNNYLDCQDGGAIYTDTGIENEEFAFEPATETEVTLTLSKVGWATLMLPFDAELPEGVKAWSCGEVNGEELTLKEASSIKANTPYLISGNAGTYNFSGYGLADKDNYVEGLFTGTYVDFKTEANSNTYVLQKKTIDGKDDVAFYLVGDSAQPTVGAYRCYMTYEATPGESAATKFSFGRGEGTTSIDNMESTANSQQPIVIYDLMGRKVNTMEKGGIYIVNGKKVIVK